MTKQVVRSQWMRGICDAEDMYQNGWVFLNKTTDSVTFWYRQRQSTHTYHSSNMSYICGMMDYVEHRKLNGEVYEGR